MAVYVQRSGNIAMPQPCLDVLGVTASLAQSVNGRMSQIMEADHRELGALQYPLEVVGHKIWIDGSPILLHTDITTVRIAVS